MKQITQSYGVAGDQLFVAERLLPCCDPNCLETNTNVATCNTREEARGQATNNTLRALGCIPALECTSSNRNLDLIFALVPKNTRSGSRHRFACLEAASRWCLRKLGRQGARFARRRSRFHPLTPHLARSNLSTAFALAQPAAKAFQDKNSSEKRYPPQERHLPSGEPLRLELHRSASGNHSGHPANIGEDAKSTAGITRIDQILFVKGILN
jgi:hypothetical protein